MTDSAHECLICGVEIDKKYAYEQHVDWCRQVEGLKDAAKDGKELEPRHGTTHQFCEALNRLGAEL